MRTVFFGKQSPPARVDGRNIGNHSLSFHSSKIDSKILLELNQSHCSSLSKKNSAPSISCFSSYAPRAFPASFRKSFLATKSMPITASHKENSMV